MLAPAHYIHRALRIILPIAAVFFTAAIAVLLAEELYDAVRGTTEQHAEHFGLSAPHEIDKEAIVSDGSSHPPFQVLTE